MKRFAVYKPDLGDILDTTATTGERSEADAALLRETASARAYERAEAAKAEEKRVRKRIKHAVDEASAGEPKGENETPEQKRERIERDLVNFRRAAVLAKYDQHLTRLTREAISFPGVAHDDAQGRANAFYMNYVETVDMLQERLTHDDQMQLTRDEFELAFRMTNDNGEKLKRLLDTDLMLKIARMKLDRFKEVKVPSPAIWCPEPRTPFALALANNSTIESLHATVRTNAEVIAVMTTLGENRGVKRVHLHAIGNYPFKWAPERRALELLSLKLFCANDLGALPAELLTRTVHIRFFKTECELSVVVAFLKDYAGATFDITSRLSVSAWETADSQNLVTLASNGVKVHLTFDPKFHTRVLQSHRAEITHLLATVDDRNGERGAATDESDEE